LLGPEAMKKYQQNFNLIYSGGSSENSDNKKDSGTKDQNNISDNVSNVPLSPTHDVAWVSCCILLKLKVFCWFCGE
jgi:hypothetical protein